MMRLNNKLLMNYLKLIYYTEKGMTKIIIVTTKQSSSKSEKQSAKMAYDQNIMTQSCTLFTAVIAKCR